MIIYFYVFALLSIPSFSIASRIDEFFCNLPAFPGVPAPSCDPANSNCCAGFYCVVDPSDPAGVLHICQDYQSAKFPSIQQLHNSTSIQNLRVAALLSLRASDQAQDILNNLQRSYQMLADELRGEEERIPATMIYSNNINALGKAAIITTENKRRSSKPRADNNGDKKKEEEEEEDKFNWSSYIPNQQGSENQNGMPNYSQYYKGSNSFSRSGNHRGYVNNVTGLSQSIDAQEEEIKNLLIEAHQDLQQVTELMKEKILSDTKDAKESAMTSAQTKMIETAHGLIASAMQLIEKINESLENADKNLERKANIPSTVNQRVDYYSKERKTPNLIEIHAKTINALDSSEAAAEALACADHSSDDWKEHCKNLEDSTKLTKAVLQIINAASQLEFEWSQFAPKDINTGDRAIGTLDGPCGKTSEKDFGKCQKPLECVGTTKFAPGKCKHKLTKKQRLIDAINFALDAADTANVFANQVRTAVSHIQVSIKNSKDAMDVLTNRAKPPSTPTAPIDVDIQSATAATVIFAVISSAIGILLIYSCCIRGRSSNRDKYEPIGQPSSSNQ